MNDDARLPSYASTEEVTIAACITNHWRIDSSRDPPSKLFVPNEECKPVLIGCLFLDTVEKLLAIVREGELQDGRGHGRESIAILVFM